MTCKERKRKSAVKQKRRQGAGDAFAVLRPQPRSNEAAVQEIDLEGQRKSVEMKNVSARLDQIEPELRAGAEATAEELFNPGEWEQLLNSFEGDAAAPADKAAQEASSEDLWQRLSSTRWIRRPSGSHDSTITHRPSA